MTYAGLISKYVWLADTIRRFQPIGLDEIRGRYERKWGAELSERTFHRHRNAIQDIFGISVSYDIPSKGYRIEGGAGSVGEWVLDSLSVGAMFAGRRTCATASCWRMSHRGGTSWSRFLRPCARAGLWS